MNTDERPLIGLAYEVTGEQVHSLTAMTIAIRALLRELHNNPVQVEATLDAITAEPDTALDRALTLLGKFRDTDST